MRLRQLILMISLGASIAGCASHAQREYDQQAAPDFLFRPRTALACGDRVPGQLPEQKLPPGTRSFAVVSPAQASWMRTRLETLTFPRAQLPALTVASSEGNLIDIAGSGRADWSLNFCARGEGDTDAQARGYLQSISLAREGGLVTLDGPGRSGRTGAWGTLSVDAPADAPIMIHDSFGAVQIQNMAGPVWVSSAHARATILNTTGRVDVTGSVVDFAGLRGTVMLNAADEIDLKLTGKQFVGSVYAGAQRSVRVLLQRDFQTPFQAVVSRRKDFVCRAELCSKIQSRKDGGWYTFTYSGDGSAPPARVSFQSEHATVVIDTWD